MSYYDGRRRLASLEGTGAGFAVVMRDGLVLGTFKSLKAAATAIAATHGGFHA